MGNVMVNSLPLVSEYEPLEFLEYDAEFTPPSPTLRLISIVRYSSTPGLDMVFHITTCTYSARLYMSIYMYSPTV